jgi:hypothetical protein
MNLSNFERHISSEIVDRGFDYYLNDRVDEPKPVDDGRWRARVDGTHTYHAEIHINPENDHEIESWRCDCPYDYGPVCKHVVAALYAISKDEDPEPTVPGNDFETSSAVKRKKIFEEASREDLQEFVNDCVDVIDGFENRFVAYFAELLDEEPNQKYRTIINNYILAAENNYGYIDYDDALDLMQPLYELNEKADELLYSGNIRESLIICRALIEEVSDIFGDIDQAISAEDVIASAFDTLSELIEKAPPIVKDELFEWCSGEFTEYKYQDYGLGSYFLHILPQLSSSQEQEKRFFTLLDDQIAIAKQSKYSDFRVQRLIQTKINYLQANDRGEEALQLLEDNIHFWEFRMKLVDRTLNNGDFKQAKKLCEEGIKEAEAKNHRGTIARWKEKRYEIAEMEGNIPDIRKRARDLFINGYKMQWCRALKNTYSKDEWPDKCEELINHIKGPKERGGFGKGQALADIFIEEGYKKRLLKLLQLNDNDFSFVIHYLGELSDEYPYEILGFYQKGITKYAKQTGRKNYRQIADWLGAMKEITGGDEQAYDLFKQLLQEYNNRPAMKDEFFKAFPEWVDSL